MARKGAAKPKKGRVKAPGKGKQRKGAEAKSPERLIDARLTKALAHPMRVHILATAAQREISPSQFSKEFEYELSSVAYHFKVLKDLDAIEMVKTRPVRGASEHIYRGTRRALFADAPWGSLPKSIQDGVAGAALQDFVSMMVHALEAGTFSAHDDSWFYWNFLTVDDLGRKALAPILAQTRDRIMALQDESLTRLEKTGKKGTKVVFNLSSFEKPPLKKRSVER